MCHILLYLHRNYSEKFCLKWNDFQDNIVTSYKDLREDTDFTNVTLACEDKKQIETHKVILAASSPFFKEILKQNKHSHPLIYMRGIKAKDLVSVLDFIYYGETNIYQEDLNDFLVIAEELQLKGLTRGTEGEGEIFEQAQIPLETKQRKPVDNLMKLDTNFESSNVKDANIVCKEARIITAERFVMSVRNEDLDEKTNSMMEKINGKWSCKMCGNTASHKTNLRNHIEAKHIEGVTHPCNQCSSVARSRISLANHVSKHHKQ